MKQSRSPLEAFVAILERLPRKVAIASDYDGTLAPIVDDPSSALPDPAAIEHLVELAERVGTVAIISGRPSSFLKEMVGSDAIQYLGLYGLDLTPKNLDDWRGAIKEVEDSAGQLAASHPESFVVETKGLSVVLHYRCSPKPEEAARMAEQWADSTSKRLGLRVLEGRMVVELVPPVPLGKGYALEKLLAHSQEPFQAVSFIGDDLGDAEAFEAARKWAHEEPGRVSLCVAVASAELHPSVASAADVVLPSQHRVADFLNRLASLAGRSP